MKKQLTLSYILILSIVLLNTTSFAQKPKTVVDSLKTLLAKTTIDTSRIKLLNELGHELMTKDSATATEYCSEALTFSVKLKYKAGEMHAHNNLGLILYYSGNYDEALKHHETAKKIAIELKDKIFEAGTLLNIGLIYDDKSDYKKALQYYMESLRLLEGSDKGKRQKGSALNNIAIIYQNQGKYDDALDFHNQALKIKIEVNNKKGIGSSLHNIGTVYKLKGDYENSLKFYFQALKIRKENEDDNGTALTLNNIGSTYEAQKLYDKAYLYFKESLEIREKQNDKYGLAISLLSIGINSCTRNQYEKGIEYFERALKIAEEIGSKELLIRSYQSFAFAYEKEEKYQKAYRYVTLLMSAKDSLYTLESSQQLNEIQTKYESEKKQKEIEILTQNDEIKSLQLNKNKLWLTALCITIFLVLLLAGLLFNRYKLKQKANDLLEHQNNEISQQKKEITDSINYAKRLQEAILPPLTFVKKHLPDSFIFYKPKDIVAGDFYWMEYVNDTILIAAADCTGHGVPGAMVSIVCSNALNRAVFEFQILEPGKILDKTRELVLETFSKSDTDVKDGMDISLVSINKSSGEIKWSGANSPLWLTKNGELLEIKANKQPIGKTENPSAFTTHTIQINKGESMFMLTDGFADQFGGEKGKKFKYKPLKELLLQNAHLSQDKQINSLEVIFKAWKANLEQVDDVCIIGIRL